VGDILALDQTTLCRQLLLSDGKIGFRRIQGIVCVRDFLGRYGAAF
jgi:hypothetical protein